jgi:hypothetical protein
MENHNRKSSCNGSAINSAIKKTAPFTVGNDDGTAENILVAGIGKTADLREGNDAIDRLPACTSLDTVLSECKVLIY